MESAMNLRDLEYLVAIADLRSFGAAAKRCFVSQPTLSGQIKKLEASLGARLFERTNKQVMPTEIGQAVVEAARRVLAETEAIREIAESSRDPFSGRFRLGAFPTLSTYLFPELVSKIARAMPKLRLILVEEKTAVLLARLQSGELDAALVALPIPDGRLSSRELFNDPFLLAVSPAHPLAKNKRVHPDELSRFRLMLLDEGHCLRDQALELCRLEGITEEPDFRATSLETLRQMVKAGTGITLMPAIAARDREPGIRYIPFAAPAPSRRIGLVWRKTSVRLKIIERLASLLAP
jgi:LysR family hydrogen peroxide-inducible transcriptional activator